MRTRLFTSDAFENTRNERSMSLTIQVKVLLYLSFCTSSFPRTSFLSDSDLSSLHSHHGQRLSYTGGAPLDAQLHWLLRPEQRQPAVPWLLRHPQHLGGQNRYRARGMWDLLSLHRQVYGRWVVEVAWRCWCLYSLFVWFRFPFL